MRCWLILLTCQRRQIFPCVLPFVWIFLGLDGDFFCFKWALEESEVLGTRIPGEVDLSFRAFLKSLRYLLKIYNGGSELCKFHLWLQKIVGYRYIVVLSCGHHWSNFPKYGVKGFFSFFGRTIPTLIPTSFSPQLLAKGERFRNQLAEAYWFRKNWWVDNILRWNSL